MIDAAAAAMSGEEFRGGGGGADVRQKRAHGFTRENLNWWIGRPHLSVSR
jgi:hypothetical protein